MFPDEDESTTRPSKRRRFSDSHLVFTAKDKTVWTRQIVDDQNIGRMQQQNVLKEIPDPTSYAKRNVSECNVFTSFSLFIDRYIVEHIVKCTENEAQSKLQDESWKTSKEEIYKLFGIMLARGLLAKGQPVDQIWSKEWGINYFSRTMSRNRYKELLKYIRFDIRSTRSERLRTDKFALVSII